MLIEDLAGAPMAERTEGWDGASAMNKCGSISDRTVCSERDYIIFSHTRGLLSEHEEEDSARRFFEDELAQYAERGKESDALLFRWSEGRWVLCGSLYDQEKREDWTPLPAGPS